MYNKDRRPTHTLHPQLQTVTAPTQVCVLFLSTVPFIDVQLHKDLLRLSNPAASANLKGLGCASKTL